MMEETYPEKDLRDAMITSTFDSTNTKQQSKPLSHQCKICGGSALNSNYGAITCSPCKMFFKRNAAVDQVSHHKYIFIFLFMFVCLEPICMRFY
jgi:hypothetical protein